MIQDPTTRKTLNWCWVASFLAISLNFWLFVPNSFAVDPEVEMQQILKRIDEITQDPEGDEGSDDELEALINRYDQLRIQKEEAEAKAGKKDKPKKEPSPRRSTRSKSDPNSSPRKTSARKPTTSSRDKGKPTRSTRPDDRSKPKGTSSARDEKPSRSQPDAKPDRNSDDDKSKPTPRSSRSSSRKPTRKSTPTSSRRGTPSRTDNEEGVAVQASINVDAENFLKPYWEREYLFSFKDVPYADLIESFSRMSGLPVVGDAPDETVSFVSGEMLGFKTALGRVQMLLFKHPSQYWILPQPLDKPREYTYLEIKKVNELRTVLPLSKIFPTLEEYLAANLEENDIALLLYTPETGSIADLEPLREFMPDYFLTAPYPDTNSQKVFGLVSDINKYLALIKKFKVTSDDPRAIEIIKINHVDASEAMDQVEELMEGFDAAPGNRASRRKPGETSAVAAQARSVIVLPDDERKQVLVKAMPSKIEEIKQLLVYVDVPEEGPGDHEPILVKIQNTSVENVMAIVRPILSAGADSASKPKRRSKPKRSKSKGKSPATPNPPLETDELTMIEVPQNNAVILIGEEEAVAKAKDLIARFDVPDEVEVRKIHPENRDPEALVALITEMMDLVVPGSTVDCRLGPDGDTVLLSGLPGEVSRAADILTELDFPADDEDLPTVHTARLEYATPSEVVAILGVLDSESDSPAPAAGKSKGKTRRRGKATSGTKFQPNDESGILYVICTDEEWAEYLPVIEKLDLDQKPTEFKYTRIAIEYIAPEEAVTQLQAMLGGEAGKKRRPKGKAAVAASGGVKMIPLADSIIVSDATETEIESIRQLLAEIDVDPIEAGVIVQRIFTLESIEATDLIAILESTFGGAPAGGKKGAAQQSDMRFIDLGGRLMVWAPKRTMEKISELIPELDTDNVERELRTYDFEVGTDVADLAQTMQKLFPSASVTAAAKGSRRKPRRAKAPAAQAGAVGGDDSIMFIPQPSSHRILVSAPVDAFPEIEASLDKIRPEGGGTPLKVEYIAVEYGDPQTIASLVEPIAKAKIAELEATGGLPAPGKGSKGSSLSIMPDPAGDRLIVLGPGTLMPDIAQWVADVDRPTDETVHRIVQLEKTDAEEMASTIKAMISGQSPSPRKSRVTRGKDRGKKPAAATPTVTSSGVNVVPAPGGNSLVLVGPAEEVDEVEKWIHMLDNEGGGGTDMKVYKFFNADVEELADIIMEVIDPGKPRKAAPKKSTDDFFDVWEDIGGPRVGEAIRLTTDPYANTMVVWASPQYIARIDELVDLYEGDDPTVPPPGSDNIPKELVELKYAEAFDASFDLESYVDVLWDGDNKPIIDYVPFKNTLVLKSKNQSDFAELKEIIAKYIDKPGEGDAAIRTKIKPIKGIAAQEMLKLLMERMPDLEVEIEDLDVEEPQKGITQLRPCVLPACMTQAMVALAETSEEEKPAAPADVQDEPAEEPAETTGEQPKKDKKDVLADLLTQKQEAQEQTEEEVAKPKIRINPRTNAIEIVGSAQSIADVERAIERIQEEIEDLPDLPDIRVFRMRYIDPAAAAQVLESMYGSGSSRARMTPQQLAQMRRAQQQQAQQQQQQGKDDEKGGKKRGKEEQQPQAPTQSAAMSLRVIPYPSLHAIILRAPSEMYPSIIELIETIDKPAGPGTDYQFYKLVNQQASEVEDMLRTMLGLDRSSQSSRQPARGTPTRGRNANNNAAIEQMLREHMALAGAEGELLGTADSITMASNDVTNTLMVKAPEGVQKLVKQIIDDLEEQVPPQILTKTVVLEHADAALVVPQLEKLFPGSSSGRGRRGGGGSSSSNPSFNPSQVNDPVVFLADSINNAVIVRVTETDWPKIEPVILGFDKPAEGERAISVEITCGDAVKMAKTLETIYGMGRGRHKGDSGKKVQFTGDASSNTIFYVAPEELRPEIDERIAGMDKAACMTTKPKFIDLQNAVASEIAKTIEGAFGGKGASGRIKVTADDRTRRLMVICPDDVFPQIESLAKDLDQPPITVETKVFILEKARAGEVANTINRLFGKQAKGADAAHAEPNNSTNSVLVRGTPSVIAEIEKDVIHVLDDVSQGQGALGEKVLELKFLQSEEAITYLSEWFAKRKDAWKQAGMQNIKPADMALTMSPLGLHQIIVNGSEDTIKAVEERLTVLDKQDTNLRPRDTIIYKLNFTDPNGVAGILRSAFPRQRRATEKELVDVGVEWSTQSVVVTASPANQKLVAALIADLDQEGVKGNAQEIYQMKNARASEVANLVNQTLRGSRRSNRKGQMPVSIVANDMLNSLIITGTQQEVTDVLDLITKLDKEPLDATGVFVKVYQVKFVDPSSLINTINTAFRPRRGASPEELVQASYTWGTSSLVVSASEENHEKVAALLAEVDVASVIERTTKVIKLKAGNAEEIAQRIGQIWRSTTRRRRDDSGMAVVADPGTNSLIVFANENEFNQVQDLVNTLDVEPEFGRQVKTFKLTFADPYTTRQALLELFRPVGRRVNPADQVSVVGDWSTNSVIVSASPTKLKEIEEFIGTLDQSTSGGREVHVIPIEHGDVDTISRALNDMFVRQSRGRQGQQTITISAPRGGQSLLIKANEEELEEIKAVIAKLDVDTEEDLVVKVYQVMFVDPNSLMRTIDTSFRRPRGGRPEDEVKASYTWGTSSLVVTASEENHVKVAKLLKEVDVESAVERSTKVIKLTAGNAEDIAQRISQIYRSTTRRRRDDTGMTVVADPGTNSLIVFANKTEYEQVQELVTTLDVKPEFNRQIKSFKLTFADPNTTRQALLELFRPMGGSRRTNPADQVSVVADWSTNSVVVSASPQKLEEIEAFITDLDQSSVGGREVHVVEIKYGDVESIARSLNDIFVRQSRGRRGQQTISISAPRGGQSLLVQANEKEFEEIEAVIAQLDKLPDDEDRDIQVFRLEYVNAEEMQTVLEEYLRRPGASSGRRGSNQDLMGNIRITASTSGNSLVVSGDKEGIERVAKVIADIDVDREDADAPQIIKLEYAVASAVEPTLTQLFAQQKGRGRNGSTTPAPIIVADDASNTLIVRASVQDYNKIEDLVGKMDNEEPIGDDRIRILQVKPSLDVNEIAATLAATLTNAVNNNNNAGKGRRGQTNTVSIEPITQNNTLVLAGDPRQLDLAEKVLRQLEQTGPAGGKEVRIIDLENMSAEEMERLINGVTEQSGNSARSGSSSRRRPSGSRNSSRNTSRRRR